MKTIAIRNNLEKVLPYVFKKLADIVFATEYDKETQVLSTDIYGSKTKFAVKYNAEHFRDYLLISNEQLDCIFSLSDEDIAIKLIISDIGDIYFEGAYSSTMRIYVNRHTSHFNSEKMKDLFEVCELFGYATNPLNTNEDITKMLEAKVNE